MEESLYLINKTQIISVINKCLQYIDVRLVHHGERVAYIVAKMFENLNDNKKYDLDKLLILSVLHDVGAYKTKEIDEMTSFYGTDVWRHSIYGYLFLKHLSPIGNAAEAIMYHHLEYRYFNRANSDYLDYAALIYLADRIDILVATTENKCDFNIIKENSGKLFKPELVDLFFSSSPQKIEAALRDGSYSRELKSLVDNINISHQEAFGYLKMLVFSVDFRSEYTVSHTINTTAISLELGKRLKLPKPEIQAIYIGAMLHDIGKIAVPPEILEYQGRLDDKQMEIMKQHVVYTGEIINGLVNDNISKIASRHHEKLDGSGYPEGLTGDKLTISQQIVAVADIISALTSKRSYKDVFSKEKTLSIIKDMNEKGLLCQKACEIVLKDYDSIMAVTDTRRDPILKIYDKMHDEFFMLNEKVQHQLT